jgi:hypothetical protein
MDLTVYKPQFPRKRIGKDNDGGYIIIDAPINYDFLIGAGINDDTSFEDHFLSLYPKLECHAFDGTIKKSPSKNPRFTWIPKNIGSGDNEDDLISYLEKYSNIFLKMDIEGHEIEWIEKLTEKHLNSLAQIVIEFHYPFSERHYAVMRKIHKTHVMFHFHENNCCGYNGSIPNVFECTFLNRRYVTYPVWRNTIPLPIEGLDQPNLLSKTQLAIKNFSFSLFRR